MSKSSSPLWRKMQEAHDHGFHPAEPFCVRYAAIIRTIASSIPSGFTDPYDVYYWLMKEAELAVDEVPLGRYNRAKLDMSAPVQ
jgi:hypothetical protein